MKTHEELIGSRWFCNHSGQEHIVTFNPIGSDYLIVNIENGRCLQNDDFQDLVKDIENNFHQ